MNINTFFLDKLLAGEQSASLGAKKISSPIGLFSDIIKVFEQESGQTSQPNESTDNSNLNSQNDLQLPLNTIECNGAKLQALSQFIDSFMSDPQLAVKATEVKHDLQSVIINKKQFLLSSGNLENFIQGLIKNLGLNNSSDLQTAISQNLKTENETGIPVNAVTASDTDVSDTQSSPKKPGGKVKTDDAIADNGTIAQALMQYLSENKTLSLSVKNGKDKININIYTLPEKNIESDLNLEKLSADFNRDSKEFNASFAKILKDQTKGKELTAATSKSLEKNPADFNSTQIVQDDSSVKLINADNAGTVKTAKTTQTSKQIDTVKQTDSLKQLKQTDAVKTALPNENVYKTEVVEITFNPAVQSKNLDSAGTQSKIFRMPVFGQSSSPKISSINNSQSDKKDFNLFDAGFRLKNNFAAQLNALQYSDKSADVSASTAKPDITTPAPIKIQQAAQVLKVVETANNKTVNTEIPSSAQPAAGSSPEKTDIMNEIKVLLGNLNGSLENASAVKSTLPKDKLYVPSQTADSAKENPEVKNDFSSLVSGAKQTIIDAAKPQNKSVNILEMQTAADGISNKKEDVPASKLDLLSKAQEVKPNIPAVSKIQKQADVVPELKPVSTQDAAATSDVPKAKAAGQEVNNILMSGMVSQKTTAADEKITIDKNADAVKSVSNDNAKNEKVDAKEAAGRESDDKDLAQNKSADNFKNVMQSTEQPKNIDTDRIKIAAEAKQIIEQPKVIKQSEIIPEVTKAIQSGEKQSMTFQLTPENLGKVKLVVDLVNNHVSTRIEVENDQVKQFIQSNIDQLKQNLQSSGVHLSNVNVSLAESDQKFAKSFTSRKKMGEKISKIKEGDDTAHRSQKSLGYNTYEYLA